MKKIISIISLVLMCSMLLVACGDDVKETKNDTTIPDISAPISTVEVEQPTETAEDYMSFDKSKVIALTFDDGPATNGDSKGEGEKSSTERILDCLEKYNCKATFFVQGVNCEYTEFKERNSALVKREHDLGMQIGNHSYDHPYFNKISTDEIKSQISKASDIIENAAGDGYKVEIMRTPGGAEKQSVKDAIDMPIILWDIDTLDWDTKDADNTYNVIMNNVKGGSIVLMHDLYQATADAVERVVPDLVQQGYKLVTIDELFKIYGKELEPHKTYYDAR